MYKNRYGVIPPIYFNYTHCTLCLWKNVHCFLLENSSLKASPPTSPTSLSSSFTEHQHLLDSGVKYWHLVSIQYSKDRVGFNKMHCLIK